MRRGTSGEGIHRTEDGRFMGVNLGADFTSEHEWGIKGLTRDFGLDATAGPGVPRRTARIAPLGYHSGTRDDGIILKAVPHKKGDKMDPYAGQETYVVAYTDWGLGDYATDELRFYKPFDKGEAAKEVVGAWDEGSFGIHFAPHLRQEAQDLYDALRACDVAFLWGNTFGNPFANAGLCLAIVSRLPQAIIEDLAEKDADNDRLLAMAEATGIKAEIDAFNAAWRKEHPGSFEAPCSYFALSPRWSDDTKTDVVFWLNPQQQKKNNFGHVTVQDLRDWMKGEGRIPVKAGAKAGAVP